MTEKEYKGRHIREYLEIDVLQAAREQNIKLIPWELL